jgi:hypothetical protein
MTRSTFVQIRGISRVLAAVVVAAVAVPLSITFAGGNAFRQNSVGGVSIDAAGVVRKSTVEADKKLASDFREGLRKVSGDLNKPVPMRMVSLRGLEQAIADANKDSFTSRLPQEIQYLAGLQRIEYVFLYPEQNDIILAGPGEGWSTDDKGNIVGVTTGRPVIHLDDLLVALRCAKNANKGQGISCSIDPTTEGRQRLDAYLNSLKKSRTPFNRSVPRAVEQAMGPQAITLTGIPADTRFSRVMVAADFQMKRYAMDLDEAPIKGLPSFLDLMKAKRARLNNMMPRWWLACNYDSIARSEDGMAWQIRGPGVKVMTEDEFIAEDGTVSGTGKVNPVAQQWAKSMTDKYEELSRAAPIFGDLRNLMDVSVVAALIEKHGMLEKVGLELPQIMNQDDQLKTLRWFTPKTVSTQCSYLKVGREYIITASGGVQVESWEVAKNAETSAKVAETYTQAGRPRDGRWWWN